MRNPLAAGVAVAAALIGLLPSAADAQIYESVGIRAQGMGGAFVAVADDADAAWWNPAGLAGGAFFNAITAYNWAQDPASQTGEEPAWQSRARSVVVAYPGLALSYYRLQVSERWTTAPAAGVPPGREDPGSVDLRLGSLVLSQFGVSVGQSITDHLVIASTLKLVRGGFVTMTPAPADGSLDRVADLQGPLETRVDLDLGAMAVFGPARFGAAVRNVRRPTFGAGADRAEVPRQVRVGASLTAGAHGRGDALTLAVDADLTRTPTVVGDARHVAAGAEAWLFQRRIGMRGGVSVNTVGAAGPTASGGISIAVRSGLYLDGAATARSGQGRDGWGLAARVTF